MKEKPALKPIQAIFKKNAIDMIMFGFVQGAKTYLPSASTVDLIEGFLDTYQLDEDEYPSESARQTYMRLNKEFIEYKTVKNERDDKV